MESFIIIGTAGHVDHGKTELVKALTGIDTDRLKEEKDRGISIELGFAPLKLSGGMTAGIVDVPGHERFVKTMLAGAGGIDLVLLVIAADEGVMPQTREHLDIIDLLQIKDGIVVITKTDLVDEEWLLLVEEEIRDLLKGTRLETVPLVPVSVVTGEGLAHLRELIDQKAHRVVPKSQEGETRLPVDRCFSKTGFGTVLTGTLVSGRLHTGDPLAILPAGGEGRIRSLQVHGEKVEIARAGQRVAVNLAGVELSSVKRGDVLATPGAFTPVRRLTVTCELLAHADKPLKNWQRVHFHLETKETLARVRLLDRDELLPGESAPAQLELEEPVVAAVHDRFVIRLYSPVTTIGGGEIIETGGLRYRRFRSEVIASLERKTSGSPAGRVVEEINGARRPLTEGELFLKTGISEEELTPVIEQLTAEGRVKAITVGGENYLVATRLAKNWLKVTTEAIGAYHRQFPLKKGYPKEEMRSRHFSSLDQRLYQALLEQWVGGGKIITEGQSLCLPGFEAELKRDQQQKLAELLASLKETPFAPPETGEILEQLGGDQDLLSYALEQGVLLRLADHYFLPAAVEEAWEQIKGYLAEHGKITVAEARDLLHTTRKFALPLLEYFDRTRRTRRVGDQRVLFR